MKNKTRRILVMTTLPLLARVPSPRAQSDLPKPASPVLVASVTPASALESALLLAAPTLRAVPLRAALAAWDVLHANGDVSRPLLTVIDYGLPSTTKRMWVFDLASGRLLFHELVAHGRNSGADQAESFSNEAGSLMTSLGAFVTGGTYTGRNGYSLRLHGMERGLNDRAEARAIVVHGAPYVCEAVVHELGRLGRSYGCPAVRPEIARALIDELKDGTLLYAWHPSMDASTKIEFIATR